MKLFAGPIGLFAFAVLATSALGQTQTPPLTAPVTAAVRTRGAEVFSDRCQVCHDPAIEGAPDASAFVTFPSQFIIQALKTGDMAPKAAGLSDDDIKAVAAYLSGQ